MKLFILLFLYICFSFAASGLRSEKALKSNIKNGAFTAQLSEGFHFNEKAPNGIQVGNQFIKPTVFLPRNITIEKISPENLKGTAHLYVCDDKVTYCEMHSITLDKNSLKPKSPKLKTSSGKTDSHGFLVNDFEAALKKARNENKILLVDFGARWCPACLRMENEIFDDNTFIVKTKGYVKAKIDIDEFASSVLKEKYNVKGVPTLLFLTSDGKEIIRFYDYQPISFIEDVLDQVKNYPASIEELETKELNPEVKQTLAKRYFFSGQNSKAIALMDSLEPQPKEYWFAKIAEAETLFKNNPTQKKIMIDTLKAAIKSDPMSSRSIVWRMNLVSTLSNDDPENSKRVAQESHDLTVKLLSDNELLKKAVQTDILGEYTGLEGFYVAMMNAETAEAAKVNPKAAWEKVIAQGEKYNVNAKIPGAALRLLYAMMKAEVFEKALKLVDSLLKEKPEDGDLQRRKMRVLMELKQFEKAIKVGEQSLKNSYGINEFFVVEPLAKSYISLNKKVQAKKLISQYLKRNEINFPDLEGIKEKLEKLNQQL